MEVFKLQNANYEIAASALDVWVVVVAIAAFEAIKLKHGNLVTHAKSEHYNFKDFIFRSVWMHVLELRQSLTIVSIYYDFVLKKK